MWTRIFHVSSPSTTRLVFYLFGENLIFRKDLESQFIFILFLRENKIRKKILSVTPYLEKTVNEKPKLSLGVRLLIENVRYKTVAPL